MQIYKAIPAIISDIEAVHKKNNPQSNVKYAYRRIDDFMNALSPQLGKHKVTIVPQMMDHFEKEMTTASGGRMNHVKAKIKYIFYAEDGSFVEAITIGEAFDSGDKAFNKAQSVALKYAIMQVFMVPTEDVDDPDDQASVPMKSSNENKSQQAKKGPPEESPKQDYQNNGKLVTEPQLKRLFAMQQKSTLSQQDISDMIKMRWKKASSKELTMAEYSELISVIEANTEAQ